MDVIKNNKCIATNYYCKHTCIQICKNSLDLYGKQAAEDVWKFFSGRVNIVGTTLCKPDDPSRGCEGGGFTSETDPPPTILRAVTAVLL